MEITEYTTGPVATNAYLYIAGGRALIVDAPPQSADVMIQDIENRGLQPDVLLLTHTHWDHTTDAPALKKRYPAMKVYVHRLDEYRLTDPKAHTVWPLPFRIEPLVPDAYVAHDDILEFGGSRFRVLHTPGHTQGSVCLYQADQGILFAGDTLFAGSVGRTDLPGGDWDTLMVSIKKRLLPLPDSVQVLSGHGPRTTIGAERRGNPFLGEE